MTRTGLSGLPRLTVTLDGVVLDEAVLLGITSLTVSRALSCPAAAELRIETPDLEPPLGADLIIELGNRTFPLFEGRLTAVEVARREPNRRILTLRGHDRLERLNRRGSAATEAGKTAAKLAEAMASALGLGLKVTPIEDPEVPLRVRRAESDYSFLLSETRRVGLFFHERNGDIWLHGLDGADNAPRPLSLDDAYEYRLEADAFNATGAVNFTAWAPDQVEAIEGIAVGLDEAKAFGRAGGSPGDSLPLFNLSAANSDVAIAEASALMRQRDAARVSLRAVFDGTYEFGLGDRLSLVRTGEAYLPEISYVVTRLEERIDAVAGHIVEISTAAPPIVLESGVAEAIWGRVVANNDPEGAGRIRCRLPTLGDTETGWIVLLRPMVSDGYGFAFVPSLGDDVLLLCPGGRAEHAVALGAMGGLRRLHLDAGDAARFGLRSRGNQQLAFDDDRLAIRLETTSGSIFELERMTVCGCVLQVT